VIVVDHSVLVSFWLPGTGAELAEAAKAKDGVWAAPILWRAEFGNVLAGYLRRKQLTEAEANAAFLNAQKDLGAQEFTVPADRILRLVLRSKCSAYECEYVALAQDLDVPLVTTNQQVLREFPQTAVSLATFARTK
jgi:predicted nucleic acid-binding protein